VEGLAIPHPDGTVREDSKPLKMRLCSMDELKLVLAHHQEIMGDLHKQALNVREKASRANVRWENKQKKLLRKLAEDAGMIDSNAGSETTNESSMTESQIAEQFHERATKYGMAVVSLRFGMRIKKAAKAAKAAAGGTTGKLLQSQSWHMIYVKASILVDTLGKGGSGAMGHAEAEAAVEAEGETGAVSIVQVPFRTNTMLFIAILIYVVLHSTS
jgi:hypothetical protein